MKLRFLSFLVLSLWHWGALAQSSLSLPSSLKGKINWDFKTLEKAPSYDWEDREDSVWSLTYEGESYRGKPTQVFAYYASPSTLDTSLSQKKKFPAVVLIHGGGGTAFRIWALEWAKKGYAAIAMDLSGNRPFPFEEQENPWGSKSTRLERGGPTQDDDNKFYRLEEDFSEQWQFHSISNVIRAHSLIRSFPEVDKERTAMTGISWGGYLTNIVAGIDHRFKAAVPVYGAGFLQEGSAWDHRFDSLGKEKSLKWVDFWDPSHYVGNSKMPLLFLNGTNDFAYFVENWHKTAQLAPNHQLSLVPELKHSHFHGAEPVEIFNFIHYHLGQGPAFASFENVNEDGGMLKSQINEGSDEVDAVYLVYTKDNKPSPERTWHLKEIEFSNKTLATDVPEEALLYYLYLVEKTGNRVSSALLKK